MIDQTLRFLRRTPPGGAIEYLAQFLIGLLHPELLRSEATPEEEHQPLPGDDLVPRPTWEATRAVSINAPAAEVWPWVEQMGYGRGGWYGWNPLEREDTGIWTLLTGLQPLNVGDILLDGPGCDETRGAWKVEAVEPPWDLVLHTVRDPVTGREIDPADKPYLVIDTVWTFHLDQISPRRTRLLDRARVRVEPRWALLPLKWMGGGDTVMQRKLLDGIKFRAETTTR